jgi:hypothetical protein
MLLWVLSNICTHSAESALAVDSPSPGIQHSGLVQCTCGDVLMPGRIRIYEEVYGGQQDDRIGRVDGGTLTNYGDWTIN